MHRRLEYIKNYEFESVNLCPLCKGKHKKFVYNLKGLKIFRCNSCSLCWLTPRMTEKDIMKFYSSPDYFGDNSDYGYDNYKLQERGLRKSFKFFLKHLIKKMPAKESIEQNTILDIGCGPGLLLDEAKSHFQYRVGTEFCDTASKRASKYADKIITGSVDNIPKNLCFDIITAISVIEHVYDPVKFMKSIHNNIHKDSLIALVTPDIDGIWRKFFQDKWPSFILPEHIIYFNKRSLKMLGDLSGFKLIEFFDVTQIFPVSLILHKLNIASAPVFLNDIMFPVPKTMIGAIFKAK